MHTKVIENFGQRHPVNATHAHQDVSSRYQFLSTSDMLGQFAQAGWQPVDVRAAGVRTLARQGFQRHIVRLEHPDFQLIPGLAKINDTKPQLVVINSHDRAASLRIQWGMYRLVCLNGMVVGASVNEVRLRHSAKVLGELPAAIATMVASLPRLVENTQRLQQAQLSAAATEKLIKTIYDARLEGVKDLHAVDYRMPSLKRYEDRATDAYTVFNRLQEVAMRGGIRYQTVANNGDPRYPLMQTDYIRNGTTRAVKSIAETVRINTVAFDAVMELVA